ncbi:hypothetical protein BS47DRAFT_1402939 [Hydnum rufescens UP504]|uniref:Uncharacterized protein n=1 Tax=Hydnum rufescens UP504 TaxID=1448309 RepID=A0A9P6DEA4_9AGAM|nr:hypothetical protein BS47DRAFT_1402939 [Hydnum rufescens UP504]
MAPPTCEESWCHKCASTIPMAPGLHILIDSRARVHQYYPAALIPAPFHVDDHQGTGVLEHKREFAQCCSDEGIKWGQVLYASSPGRSIPRPVFIGIQLHFSFVSESQLDFMSFVHAATDRSIRMQQRWASFSLLQICAANMSSNVYPSSAPPHFFRGTASIPLYSLRPLKHIYYVSGHGIALTFSFLAISIRVAAPDGSGGHLRKVLTPDQTAAWGLEGLSELQITELEDRHPPRRVNAFISSIGG